MEINREDYNRYLNGELLIGDDYNLAQITEWYKDEKEAYADLGSKVLEEYKYEYHNINITHGFNKINEVESFNKVLGIGAAYGNEFEPIASKIKEIHIIEPSDSLVSDEIFGLTPVYKKPTINGQIDYADNTFDLITCFGVLHHIPNVSFVVSELYRVLKPGGFILIREPIISMGDWRGARKGLTARERGIPVDLYKSIIDRNSFKVVSANYCFSFTSVLQRKFGFLFEKPIYAYRSYVYFDKLVSFFLSWNIKYHATSILHRFAPQNIFYVLKK